jgi:hypothetical protein
MISLQGQIPNGKFHRGLNQRAVWSFVLDRRRKRGSTLWAMQLRRASRRAPTLVVVIVSHYWWVYNGMKKIQEPHRSLKTTSRVWAMLDSTLTPIKAMPAPGTFTRGSSLMWCVCVLQPRVWGVFIGAQVRFPHVGRGESEEVEHRVAATWPAGWPTQCTASIWCGNIPPHGLQDVPASLVPFRTEVGLGGHNVGWSASLLGPLGPGFDLWTSFGVYRPVVARLLALDNIFPILPLKSSKF